MIRCTATLLALLVAASPLAAAEPERVFAQVAARPADPLDRPQHEQMEHQVRGHGVPRQAEHRFAATGCVCRRGAGLYRYA